MVESCADGACDKPDRQNACSTISTAEVVQIHLCGDSYGYAVEDDPCV
jgi:hypothetical protein